MHGPLPADQVMLLAFGIAHALADIHAANVVHRDLKPANILLDETGAKVIDFGIVKSLAQSATSSSHSTRVGTPLFMSPEQAMGRTVGPASDVFALGSTLFSLATATEAFAAENEWAVAHRVVADRPDLSHLTLPLLKLITAYLNKRPEQRPTPQQVQAWCEQQVGDTLGPGAWIRITGARDSIQQRNAALHALSLHGPGSPSTATSDQPGLGDQWSSRYPAPLVPKAVTKFGRATHAAAGDVPGPPLASSVAAGPSCTRGAVRPALNVSPRNASGEAFPVRALLS